MTAFIASVKKLNFIIFLKNYYCLLSFYFYKLFEGHKPDLGNQDDSFQRKLRTLCKTEGLIKILSTDLSVLTLDNIREIPLKLKPESLYVMLDLVKMGSSKPKTVPALCNSLKQSCHFMYVLPPVSTLARVFVKVCTFSIY